MSWTWHRIFSLLLSIIAIAAGGISVGYYNSIRLNPEKCSEISSTKANVGLWLNIVLVIFGFLIFVWTLLESGTSQLEVKDKIVHKQTNTIYHQPESSEIPHGPQYQYQSS